jgi:hypothetical protein
MGLRLSGQGERWWRKIFFEEVWIILWHMFFGEVNIVPVAVNNKIKLLDKLKSD